MCSRQFSPQRVRSSGVLCSMPLNRSGRPRRAICELAIVWMLTPPAAIALSGNLYRVFTHLIMRRFTALATFALSSSCVHAAGGHHDVDDATILDPGHCQLESWALSGRNPAAHGWHLGPACNLAGLEWGLNIERLRIDSTVADAWGPQVKWAIELVPRRLAIGAAIGTSWRVQGPDRRTAVSGLLPATAWFGQQGELQVHANVGFDRDAEAQQWRRWGASFDWSMSDRWVLTGERRQQFGQAASRLGLRFNLTPLQSVDFSLARGASARLWVLGYTVEWER